MHGFGQPAALLADGKVLVAGSSSVELFDPISRTFMLLPPMNKPGGRHMTRLLDGDVLFSGAEMPELELYTYGTAGEPGIYLYVTNPVPQINSVSALEFQLGRAAQITVSGHNFISAGTGPSRVTFNGSYYYCQYSTTEDQIVSCVPLSQMNAGTYNVAVFTPGPGGGYSNSIPIVVRAP